MLHASVKCEKGTKKQGNGNPCVQRFCDCDRNQRSCSNAVIEKVIKAITPHVYGDEPDDILGGGVLCGSLLSCEYLFPKIFRIGLALHRI